MVPGTIFSDMAAGRGWRVVIHPAPTPNLTEHQIPERLAEAWKTAEIANGRDGHGDFEDWTEQAERLYVAQQLLPDAAWTYDLQNWKNISSEEAMAVDLSVPAPHWGVVPSSWISDWKAQQPAADYLTSRTFQRHAGRTVTICGVNPQDGLDVRDVVTEHQTCGKREVIVKARTPKRGLWRIDLDREPAVQAVERALDWEIVTLDGQSNALAVQDVIAMRYEYRIFVVDHRPVTGAGAIEQHTPLNAIDLFNSAMTERRNPESAVEHRPDLVSRYRTFAGHVTSDWRREQRDVGTYTLDVALVNDQPVIVERNDLANSGFYASTPRAVLVALRACPQAAMFAPQLIIR